MAEEESENCWFPSRRIELLFSPFTSVVEAAAVDKPDSTTNVQNLTHILFFLMIVILFVFLLMQCVTCYVCDEEMN